MTRTTETVEHVAVERVAVEHVAVEHAGVEHAGIEHAGVEHAGIEHAGVEHAGVEHAGVEHFAAARVPTTYGSFVAHAYRSLTDGEEHVAYVMGDVAGGEPPLVRLHSECLTGDILSSIRCDCGQQLRAALHMISEEGRGVLVYLRGHEGRGIGLGHKIRAYALQDVGLDTVEANEAQGLPIDSRSYGVGAGILADLGITSMRLMTNNPLKLGGLADSDLEITERVPIEIESNPENLRYLETKRDRLGHTLTAAP